jgi:hypothetical protein
MGLLDLLEPPETQLHLVSELGWQTLLPREAINSASLGNGL